MRILVVEDERKLAEALAKTLRTETYAVDVAHTGQEAESQLEFETYDLVIMDIGLPGKDGISVCQAVRANNNQVPILLLTARDASSDKVLGLDAGADDYMVKPFDVDELLARVRSLLRRPRTPSAQICSINDLEVDRINRIVKRSGQVLSLTAKEYALIEYLVSKPGAIVTKEELLNHVWDMNTDPFSKVVDVYIGYLRNKIDRAFPTKPPLIQTVKGMGYKIGI